MPLIFPSDCVTPADRTEYAYRCQELLRLRHNEVGADFRDGKLTEAEWNSFIESTINPAANEVIAAILKERGALKESKRWDIKVEDLL